MRIRKATPFYTILLVLSTLVAGIAALVLMGVPYAQSSPAPFVQTFTAADSDSVATQVGELATDSADTTTGRVARYLSQRSRSSSSAGPLQGLRPNRNLRTPFDAYLQYNIKMDSSGRRYVVHEVSNNEAVRAPLSVDRSTYRQHRLQSDLQSNWQQLIEQQQLRSNSNQNGFGVNVVIPGAQESAFTTIFGKPEVDLRVNGQANIDLGFNYQKSDQRVSLTGEKGRLDPDFGQDIMLGITGSIGDKLQVDVNWDTKRTFDYENQLKLEYTGYDDDIVQKVVAGNVFLNTPSQLIQSGQSLFGIRSDLQLGGLNLTTVMSQQEGQSNELSIEGGSQTTEFNLRPTEYENNTHFFLGYYFRNSWEPALSDPTQIMLGPNFQRITDIEVWRITQTQLEGDNERQVVALADLGEPSSVRQGTYTGRQLPSPSDDAYSESDLDQLRDGSQAPNDYLEQTLGLTPSMYQWGEFRKLNEGSDYEFDSALGYLSLKSSLSNNEALAVSFRYQRRDGEIVEVGDFVSGGGSTRQVDEDRLVLKLLRTANPQPSDPTWDLTLRNIYKIPGRGINQNAFDLSVQYHKPGTPAQSYLPDVTLPGQQTLLQALGLDRLNSSGSPSPDNTFDYRPGVTIKPGTGRVIFPYLEPFNQRISELLQDDRTQVSGRSKEEAVDLLAFSSLYNDKKKDAERDSQHDIYRIDGSYKGSVQEVYNLGFGIVEGSVQVTSGGVPLTAGQDYQVDHVSGTVTVTNPAYLTPGRDVNITYERNQMMAIQKKTLLGLRADYQFQDFLNLGATAMRLSEKPLTDKFRVGEEPLSNTIWGLDGALDMEPRWLTRAVDALPLVQTKAPSSISIKGEVAQLRPGYAETVALERTQRQLNEQGLDMNADERGGVSFLDDFEGVENNYSLSRAGAWSLSSTPAQLSDGTTASDSLKSNLRANLTWYKLPRNVYDHVEIKADNTEAVRPVHINEVYPEKDVRGESIQDLQTFDLYFDPKDRGPYNFTQDLKSFKNNPQYNWGGMTQRIPEGYSDFTLQNIEFVEFVFSPHSQDVGGVAAEEAKLYVNLGTISEDIVPNGRLNKEDGLPVQNVTSATRDKWSRVAAGVPDGVINVDESSNKTEDRGLNGLPSSREHADYEETEQEFYADFLASVKEQFGENSPEYQKALNDPAADDYHYWRDDDYYSSSFFTSDVLLQERFSRFFPSSELNSFEAQRQVTEGGQSNIGNSRGPDSEDLNLNHHVDTENSYYEYSIPLSKNKLDQLADPSETDDHIVTKINGQVGDRSSEWYLVRIPVREFKNKVGNINGFSFIESMRLWTTGHRAPATLRFASMELVGSRWEKAKEVGNQANNELQNTNLAIATVNNEENSDVYRIPNGAIRSQTRLSTGQSRDAREQAMSLRIKNLAAGDERAITKTSQGLDLLKYSNIRMFMHGHAQPGEGFDERGDLEVFVRLGLNNTNDYYEYSQPLTPSNPVGASADQIWQTNQQVSGYDHPVDLNSMNIDLSALNKLKAERDNRNMPVDSLYVPNKKYSFAPPGTRLGIKGQPSLSGVQTIMIGVRNPADSLSGKVVKDATVWVNELRVSGYDDKPGWASLASARIKLADLARIDANFRTKSDRFGELSSGLANRQQTSTRNWGLNSTINLDKFIPEDYGWSIPVSYSIRSNQSTPRYSPNRGDIRLQELLAQIEESDQLSPAEKQVQRQQVINNAQTQSVTRSISVRTSKRSSNSPVLRHTLDALSLSYNHSGTFSQSPSTKLNDSWQWSTALNYRLNLRKPYTVQPFGFLDNVWGLGWLSPLQVGYLPSSVSFSATANRRFGVTRDRPRYNPLHPQADSLRLEAFRNYPFRENHQFLHKRSFGLRYNPFGFLGLSYNTNVNQNFNPVAIDTTFQVATQDKILSGMRWNDAVQRGLADSNAVEMRRLQVNPVENVLQDILQGSGGNVRTESYNQTFSGNLQPNTSAVKPLDWISVQPISYDAQFRWQNGPIGRDSLGARVSNDVNLQGDLQLGLKQLWRKFEFYRELEDQQNQGSRSEQNANDSTQVDDNGFLPSWSSVARRALLTLTSMRDLRLSFRSHWSGQSSNVKGGYNTFDAFNGSAPSLGYRLGLQQTLPPEDRWIQNRNLQINDNLGSSYTLGAQTTLSPTQRLDINLNSDVSWTNNDNISYRYNPRQGIAQTTTSNGQSEVTTWGLSGSYKQFYKRQLERYRADQKAAGGGSSVGDANGDGQVVLTNRSLVSDFQNTFVFSSLTADKHGFLPLPLPNWNVTYSGLGKWPLISRLVDAATVRHGYTSNYSTSFSTNAAAGLDNQGNPRTKFFDLGGQNIEYTVPGIEAGSVRLNEKFQPLIGLNLTWNGGFQTSVTWSKQKSLALSPTNADVRSSRSNSLTISANYSKRGLRLPFPLPFVESRTLNNTLRFSLSVSRSTNISQRYLLASDLEKALTGRTDDETFLNPPVQASRRLSIEPRLTYRFSNRVSADFFMRYQHLASEGSRAPTNTNLSGGFNIRVSISNASSGYGGRGRNGRQGYRGGGGRNGGGQYGRGRPPRGQR